MHFTRTSSTDQRPSSRSVHLVICLLVIVFNIGVANAQAYSIFNGTTNACAGAFLDSGGQGASGYGNNENYTYTICPDVPGGAISLNFLTFNLSTGGAAPIDFMTIYDGNSTAAPQLVNWTGTAGQGQIVSASGGNPTGCLTIVFRSNNTGTGVFAASITCYQPCIRPTATATHGATNPQRICPGESVTFNSSASTAAAGNSIASRRWDFGDGTILNNAPALVNHTYAQPGGYMAQLTVFDNNGCASTNQVDLLVLVGTQPTFNGTGGTLTGCAGETLCLNGAVQGTTWTETPNPNLGSGVFLPDIVGQCFESNITYDQFPPGATLTNVNGLLSICLEMEHSYMGDLIINIISPTGQTVTMHQQGGGATFLGVPVDNDLTPNAQGTCFNYCWNPTATNGTWADNATGTLPSGTYESLNPLSGLVGSQLNGTWTIQVCDMWALDNGFICNWNIDFNPSLFDDLIEFTPTYGAQCDSTYWTGPNITSQTANCDQVCVTPPAPGNYNYVYHVTDNFGCTYDTTLTVNIIPGPLVNAGPDATTCNTPVQLGATITGGGFPTTCTYTLTLYDSFGDGWTGLFGGSNGSNVTVNVNGVPSSWTLPNGSQGSTTITVSTGSTISLSYTAGSLYNGEQSYTLFNSTGGVVYASPTGPGGGLAWSGVANCPSGGFVYSWTPAAGLNDPNIANPTATVSGTTQYCVTVYQAGHPLCTSTDCVTITVDNQVDPGTNANVAACSNGGVINMFAQLGGTPTAGGTWTAPAGASHSGSFQPGVDPPGAYTYTVGGAGACGTPQSSTVNVTVHPLPNAGTSSSMAACSTDAAQSMFALLGGSAQAGGTWSGPSPVVGGNYDPTTMNPGVYTYTVNGTAPCPNAIATVTVAEGTPPNAGNDASITLCNTSAPVVMVTQLGGSPSGTGSWTAPGGATVSGGLDPAVDPPGVYTYTVTGTAPCPNDLATLTVAINQAPNAGTNGAITLCSSDAPASLFAQLGGAPDAGGAWSGPSPVVGGILNPATMSAGVYTYTVNGIAPCISASSSVTVAINAPSNAGSNGSLTLCTNSVPASLFGQLGGTPQSSGTWSGPSAVAGGVIDPATMNAGIYTYTVAGTAPCPDVAATVAITINAMPNAGIDGGLTLCSSSPASTLFSGLNGTPDAGGTWTAPGGGASNGTFTPGVSATGIYTYTVNGTAPCPAVSATVEVSVVTNPDAGLPGNATVCASDAVFLLFSELGGTPDAGGAWSGPSPVIGGQYDPATMNPGVYTYTITVPPPCVNASSTVAITEIAPPNAGTDGALTLCISSPATSLFAALGGGAQAGGTWSGPSPVVGGMFEPATMTAGVYTYTVNGTTPCPNDQSTVTVTVVSAPDAGTPGSAALCATDVAIDLYAELGGTPDLGGTWSGPSPVIGGQYDPATMNPGVYTYTITVPPPCVNASSTVAITEIAPPNAGTDGALTLCISSPAASLFAALGGGAQAGGMWSGPSPVVGGSFNPSTMAAGVYSYTVNGTTPCPDDQSTVSVTVVSTPDPGGPGFLTICATDAPDDLFSYLEGTPDQGGQWTTPSGTVATGIFDPASMTAGVYTYTIAVPPPCVIVSSTVTVDVIAAPDAGQDGAATLCLSGAPIDLFSVLGGSPDAGGAWTTSAGAPFSSVFDPAANAPGVYNYTVNGTAPCPADVSSVTIAVTELPNAGSNAILNLCIVGVPADLFNALGAADVGGTWIGPSGASTGVFTPGTSIAGNYTYTVAGSPPCPSASATVTVNVLSNADAGGDGGTTVCGSDGPVSLFTLLQGSPDAGGSWFGPTGTATTGTFDPAISTPGQYTYILYVPAPCQNDTAQVVMGVVAPVSAGSDGSATLCSNDASVALFNLLNGTPDVGGTWTAPNGGPSEGSFTPGTDMTGGYVYTVYATAPCTDQSAFVTLGVNPLPNAGTNGSITLCPEAAPISLFSMLGGSPMSGGSWTGPNGQPSNGIFDPATSPQGAYTYTVTGLSPCPNAVASSTATVFLIAPPNAGPDAVSCTLEFTLNATGNWASGSWTGPAGITFSDPTSPTSTVTAIAGGAYTLTWSVTSNDGCATQDEVIITFTDALVPVIATTDAICNGACNGTASVATTGGNGAYSFAWSGGIAGNTPSATGICAGSYTVTVSDANNCSTAALFTIGEPEALDIDAIASVNETCPGSCDGSITITDPQGAQYSINGGTGFQTGNPFTGLCPGEYAIVMLDANGCTASGIASIASPPPVIAYFTFSPDSLLASDPEAQFNNLSSPNATAFSWDFAGLGSSTAASPTFTFPGTLGGLYTVCLTATDANGCPDTYCAPVQVFDALLVHVANVFSPNDDGINEGFAPVFNMNWAVGDYEFLVFNRWGELLYETHVVDEKWDGVHGGGGVETEVFVWKLRCRDRLTRQWIERIGHVTVLK